jgi:hypothetical protein
MSQSEQIECPICYDAIDQLKNCVTTECGHQFHCKCLMQNSAQNGFSCPMCRSTMATEPEISDSGSESEFEDFEDEDPYDDNALTSFRMFHQQLDNEEVEEEPEEERHTEELEEEEQIVKPTAAIIAAKLVAQGFSMEDMVKCLLIDHEEYESDADRYERLSDRMFGKFRQIISNYPREQQEEQEIRVSSRLRVEDSFASLQNRYRILQDDSDISDEEV